MKLANKNETTINPATEDTLLGVKTAVEAIGGGGDGAILDGVSSAIKATVHDYTNSNPLAVVLRDTNGDYVSVGGGTQYADGAVRGTATGTIAMGDDGTNIQSVHVDTSGDLQVDVLTMPTVAVTGTFYQATQPISAASLPLPTDAATQTTLALIKAKTDNIPALGQALAAASVPIVLTAAQETALTPPAAITGFATSAKQDTGNTSLSSIDGKVPALGQALAAASVPVILPSATITTLTPPAAITGFATSAKQDTLLTELQLKADLTETQPVSLASVPSHAVTNAGTFAVQATEADGANVTLGAKADAKSTATDATAITVMQVLKQISASVQAPPSQAVTGTFWQATQPVSLATLPVTNAGTFAVQGTAVGTIADDATTPGAPVMIGGKAVETDGTDPTSVSAEDDVAIFRTDRNRRLLVNTAHPNLWNVSADYASAQTNTSVKAAPGASLSLYITDISISNGAVAGNITLLDGSGGTVKYEIYPAINGGAVHALRTPIRLTANTALCVTSTTVTTHSLNISGYIAP